MAWSAVLTALFPAYTSDGTNCTIPIAAMPELTAAEAHTTTGDSRKWLFALCSRTFAWFNALATADRPTKMVITKSVSVNSATGISTQVFTFTFTTEITGQEVSAE